MVREVKSGLESASKSSFSRSALCSWSLRWEEDMVGGNKEREGGGGGGGRERERERERQRQGERETKLRVCQYDYVLHD